MKIPYGYSLVNGEIVMEDEKAEVVHSIFAYYLAGASLGKVVDMLFAKGILSPTGKPKWARAAVDKLLGNAKYTPILFCVIIFILRVMFKPAFDANSVDSTRHFPNAIFLIIKSFLYGYLFALVFFMTFLLVHSPHGNFRRKCFSVLHSLAFLPHMKRLLA